jgi:hypothetical protein
MGQFWYQVATVCFITGAILVAMSLLIAFIEIWKLP